MNEQLQTFARKQLKQNLAECTLKQQEKFKAMYNDGNYFITIDRLVDSMPEAKLDWAMEQTIKTLSKNQPK